MKRFLILIVSVLLISCGEDFEHESQFERSYKSWSGFKQESNNSYKYLVSGATWSGSSWETEIVVEQGEVVERNFRYTSFNGIWRPETGWTEQFVFEKLSERSPEVIKHEAEVKEFAKSLEWTERKVELGTHTSTPAANLWTLDEVYQNAKDTWLSKRNDAKVYFETENNGMISSVGFVINNCQDDCFNGINIKWITKL